eukprot:2307910-Karenia_brevis.AAC.1
MVSIQEFFYGPSDSPHPRTTDGEDGIAKGESDEFTMRSGIQLLVCGKPLCIEEVVNVASSTELAVHTYWRDLVKH